MRWIARLNKPWLHFVVLGLLFYQAQSWLFPEPKPLLGPLSEARITTLKNQWQASTGRSPTAQQLSGYIAAELDRDMLLQRALDLELHLNDAIVYQRLVLNMKFLQLAGEQSDQTLFKQAIDMQLHLDDEVVKRRLIQLMEQRLVASYPSKVPSDEEILAFFDERKASLRQPPRYSFEHIFLNEQRAPEMASIVAKISEQNLDINAARRFGSPFLQGRRFQRQTPEQLTRNFGRHFATALQDAAKNRSTPSWLGPVASAYGLHYVMLENFEPARDVEFSEVKPQLLVDLGYLAQKNALACAIVNLWSEFRFAGKETLQSDPRKDDCK